MFISCLISIFVLGSITHILIKQSKKIERLESRSKLYGNKFNTFEKKISWLNSIHKEEINNIIDSLRKNTPKEKWGIELMRVEDFLINNNPKR